MSVDVAMPYAVPKPRRQVRLACPGSSHVGTVINERYLKVPCRKKRCLDEARASQGWHRDERIRVFHRFDLATGQIVESIVEKA